MGFKSFKTRILFLIVATMVVTLAAIIILTLRDYERTILEAGEESAKNVLHLVMLDIENEYRGLQYYKKSRRKYGGNGGRNKKIFTGN